MALVGGVYELANGKREGGAGTGGCDEAKRIYSRVQCIRA